MPPSLPSTCTDCPVCSRMVAPATDTHDNLEIRLGRTVLEFSLTPLPGVCDEAVYVQVMRDVTHHRRLNHLYEMLSATNRAIIHSQTAETLMNAVFEALVTSGTYTLLFIAKTDTGNLPMKIIREHGIDPLLLPRLALNLGTPDSVFGQAFPRFAEERLICFPVAAGAATMRGRNTCSAKASPTGPYFPSCAMARSAAPSGCTQTIRRPLMPPKCACCTKWRKTSPLR